MNEQMTGDRKIEGASLAALNEAMSQNQRPDGQVPPTSRKTLTAEIASIAADCKSIEARVAAVAAELHRLRSQLG